MCARLFRATPQQKNPTGRQFEKKPTSEEMADTFTQPVLDRSADGDTKDLTDPVGHGHRCSTTENETSNGLPLWGATELGAYRSRDGQSDKDSDERDCDPHRNRRQQDGE